MIYRLAEGLWSLVFGGLLLLIGMVNQALSGRNYFRHGYDFSGTDDSEDFASGSGSLGEELSTENSQTINNAVSSTALNKEIEDISHASGYLVIGVVVGCTLLIIIAIVVSVVFVFRRKNVPGVNGGMKSQENNYEIRNHDSPLQSTETRYASLNIPHPNLTSPVNATPIYEEVKFH